MRRANHGRTALRAEVLGVALLLAVTPMAGAQNRGNPVRDQNNNPTDYNWALHAPGDPADTYHVTVCAGSKDYRFYPIAGQVGLPADAKTKNTDPPPPNHGHYPATGTESGQEGAVDVNGRTPGDANLDITMYPRDGSASKTYHLRVHVIACPQPPGKMYRGRDINDRILASVLPPTKLEQGFLASLGRGSATTRAIGFAAKSASLGATQRSALDEVVGYLRANPKVRIEVQSYAAAGSSAEASRSLTQRRADAVKAYLTSQGIAANRLTAKGYGGVSAGESAGDRLTMVVLKN
ncbi:MAG TPA: OmpA family protein [Gemmatimonadaceae bacterium]|nr:OmpA family protein [Gemmatimonadaceae bacterium]